MEMLDEEVLQLRKLVRTGRHRLNGLARMCLPPDLGLLRRQCRYRTNTCNAPRNRFQNVINFNRSCAILPFLFSEQTPKDALTRHSASTPRYLYLCVRSQPQSSFHFKTPAMVSVKCIPQTFPTEVDSTPTKQLSLNASNMHLPTPLQNPPPNRYVAKTSTTPPPAKYRKQG